MCVIRFITYTSAATHTATHCNTLQHILQRDDPMSTEQCVHIRDTIHHALCDVHICCNTHCNTLQHTLQHTLQNTATHTAKRHGHICDTIHHALCNIHICCNTHCNTLQHTLQRDAFTYVIRFITHYETFISAAIHTATHCNTLQHTLQRNAFTFCCNTHCNTLQHTATHIAERCVHICDMIHPCT